jgi:hypothetical protein
MRIIGILFAMSLALAALKAAMVVLAVIYPLALLWAIVVRPRETFGFLLFFLVMFLIDKHPVATLATIVTLVVVGATVKRLRMPP